jgi:hypothetical protein
VPFGARTFSEVMLEACGAPVPVSLALLPVIFASIELAFELVTVILLLSFVCENTLPICPVTIPLRNIAVMVIAKIMLIVPVMLLFITSTE